MDGYEGIFNWIPYLPRGSQSLGRVGVLLLRGRSAEGGEQRLLGLTWHLGVYAPFACQGRFLPSTPPAHK
jgi:hypothetical protein